MEWKEEDACLVISLLLLTFYFQSKGFEMGGNVYIS